MNKKTITVMYQHGLGSFLDECNIEWKYEIREFDYIEIQIPEGISEWDLAMEFMKWRDINLNNI